MAIGCVDCGAEQQIPHLLPNTVAECRRCGRLLDQADESGLNLGLAWSIALFLLLFPAILLPLMDASLQASTRGVTIGSGVAALWREGWPLVALMYLAFTIVFPIVRAVAVLVVLLTLRTRFRPSWLGRVYRYALALRLWAMPDVLVLAGVVIYMRTAVMLSVHLNWGGYCLIAVAVLHLFSPWCLPCHKIWRAIMADREGSASEADMSCDACNLILPLSAELKPCPRCQRRLHLRKPNALYHTTALVIASYVLYFPAYYYPMSYTMQPNGIKQHTIIDGVRELIQAGYWGLAGIIFTASVLIPLFKLVGLTWLITSVYRPSSRGLVLRTRIHRAIHGIGRWSNTDPFIVGLMAPLLSFAGIIEVHVGKGALPFELVVTLTMLASRSFDARLMWDAAEHRL